MVQITSSFVKDWYGTRADVSVASDVTLTATQEFVSVDTTAAREIELPDTTSMESSKRIWIWDATGTAETNNITVIPNASDGTTIDGDANYIIDRDDNVTILELVNDVWTVLNRFFFPLKSTSVSTAYTVQTDDDVVFADTTLSAFTVTLPPLASARARRLSIKKIVGAALQLTITGDGAETIDGNANVILTAVNGPSLTLFPRTATDWAILL